MMSLTNQLQHKEVYRDFFELLALMDIFTNSLATKDVQF